MSFHVIDWARGEVEDEVTLDLNASALFGVTSCAADVLPTLYLLRPSNSSQRLTPRCVGAWSRVTFPRPQPWALVATQNALHFQHL